MLCCEICKKCYLEDDDTELCWSKQTVREWKVKRIVDCIEIYKGGLDGENWWLNVDECEPPDVCPYKLEHITLSQIQEKFTRYKITNSIDDYTIEFDDFKVVCIVVLLLGNGKYGVESIWGENKKMIPLNSKSATAWFSRKFGENFVDSIQKNKRDIIDCLRGVIIGDTIDRDIYNVTLNYFIDDDYTERLHLSGLQKEWLEMWHEKKSKAKYDIGKYARELSKKYEEELELEGKNENI